MNVTDMQGREVEADDGPRRAQGGGDEAEGQPTTLTELVGSGASEEAEAEWDGADALASYRHYNKILRTWFVAFGVGGPALFLANAQLGERLVQTGALVTVAGAFVAGAAAQVLGALLNKIANWHVYRGTLQPEHALTRRHNLAEWLLNQFWIDLGLDLVSVGSFGFALWTLFTVFARTG